MPGTASPVIDRWKIVREVEKPDRAGGHRLGDQPTHLGDVVGGGVLVVHAALAHHLEAQRAVGELGGDVERVVARAEEVEVLREALPGAPRHPLGERAAGDVLDALHQLDQRGLLTGRARREARRRSCPSPAW